MTQQQYFSAFYILNFHPLSFDAFAASETETLLILKETISFSFSMSFSFAAICKIWSVLYFYDSPNVYQRHRKLITVLGNQTFDSYMFPVSGLCAYKKSNLIGFSHFVHSFSARSGNWFFHDFWWKKNFFSKLCLLNLWCLKGLKFFSGWNGKRRGQNHGRLFFTRRTYVYTRILLTFYLRFSHNDNIYIIDIFICAHVS